MMVMMVMDIVAQIIFPFITSFPLFLWILPHIKSQSYPASSFLLNSSLPHSSFLFLVWTHPYYCTSWSLLSVLLSSSFSSSCYWTGTHKFHFFLIPLDSTSLLPPPLEYFPRKIIYLILFLFVFPLTELKCVMTPSLCLLIPLATTRPFPLSRSYYWCHKIVGFLIYSFTHFYFYF